MDVNCLRVTNKELFYTAMMLHLDQLVNVDYVFPADEVKLARELDEAKQSLQKKKLLKESAKGGITLDFALTTCAAFCSKPDDCMVVESDDYYATVYNAVGAYMLLEQEAEGQLAAVWFKDKETLDGYLASHVKLKKETKNDGGV